MLRNWSKRSCVKICTLCKVHWWCMRWRKRLVLPGGLVPFSPPSSVFQQVCGAHTSYWSLKPDQRSPTPAQHRHARREQRATHTHEYWSPKALINNQSQTYLHKVCLRWNRPQMKLSDRYLHLKIQWNLLDCDGSLSSMAQQPKVTVLACSIILTLYKAYTLCICSLSLLHTHTHSCIYR